MKRFIFLFLMTGGSIFAVLPTARAQDSENHVEFGIFGDYFRLGATRGPSLAGTGATSFGGVGARLSINVSRKWQIEPEMNYDFAASFAEGFTGASGTVAAFNTSSLRILHGMIGPKFQSGGGAFRAFLTVKGGADDFIFSSAPVTFSTFTITVIGVRANSVVGGDANRLPGEPRRFLLIIQLVDRLGFRRDDNKGPTRLGALQRAILVVL